MVKKCQTKRVWTPKRKAEIVPETFTAKRLRANFADANPLSALVVPKATSSYAGGGKELKARRRAEK